MKNNNLTPDEELELLELEEEDEREELERLKLEEEELSLSEKKLDIDWAKRQAANSVGYEEFGAIITPESEEEAEEYANTYEKQGNAVVAYFRTKSPLTNWIYPVTRKSKYWIDGIFEKKDNESFDLETKMEEDGVSESDRGLYDGVTSLREYEYIKEGVERERDDTKLLNENDGIYSVIPEILEFAMFPVAGKVAGAIGSATKIAKGMTLTDGINKILSPLSSEVLKDIVKASGIGAALGGVEYAAGYDINGNEAIARAGVYALTGGAFAGAVHGGKAIINKIANDVMARAYAIDGKSFVLDEMEKEWKNKLLQGGIGSKTVEVLATKSPLTKTHPYMMLFSKNEKTSRLARKLFVLNDEWVPQTELRPMEFRVNIYNEKNALEFRNSLNTLNKINKEVKEYDGTTSREWFARAFYGGEEVLPADLPHREKIASVVGKLEKKLEEISKLRKEVTGEVSELEESFLPYEETGKNFSIEKLIERRKKGIKGTKPRYLPRTWDRKAIIEHEEELRELMKQGLINVRLNEIGAKITPKALKEYAASSELKKAVDKQIYHLTSSPSVGKGVDIPERRIVRVDDRALYKFFSKDPLAELYDFLKREKTELEFEKTIHDAGYMDWQSLTKDIMKDYERKAKLLQGEEKEKLLHEQDQTRRLLEQTEAIIKNRYTAGENLLFGSRKTQEAIESASNCMYSAFLGTAGINSLSDIKGMVLRCGLGKVLRNIGGSLTDSINNGLRGILKLPESERRQILDSLVLGFEETRINAQLRILPTRNGELFYGPSKATIGEKSAFATRKLSNLTYQLSGSRWLDETLRRTMAWIVLKDLQKNPKYAKSIAEMIQKREFSEEIEDIVYREVNRVMNKPTLADVPSIAYNEIGRLFFALKSWSFANSSNYLYPILKGNMKKGLIASSVLSVIMMQMISESIRGISNGKPYDLSDEEDRERFSKNVLGRGLDDIAGTIGIHAGSFEGVVNSVKYKNSGNLIKKNIPLLGYGDYICSLIGGVLSLFNGTLTYRQTNKALSAIPVVGSLPYTKPIRQKLAEEISGERRPR